MLRLLNPFLTKRKSTERNNLLFNQDERLLQAAITLAKEVKTLGGKALLVGGFVRDSLTKTVSKDADIEVYGIEPERLAECLERLFPKQVDAVGRSFGVLKVFLGDGLDLDVAIPRRESKTGAGHTGFTIEGDPHMSEKEAARRRDFTVNAMAFDPLANELIDPFGGEADLEKKILRVTDAKTFTEDPLRVYRGIQFAARLGFTIEKKSFSLMKKMVERGDLEELSPERITDEWKKLLLKSERPSIGVELMRELGIIEKYYPELQAMIDVPQEPEWHPEGDVWIHSMMVLDQATKISKDFAPEERLQVIIGALVHDLGKPSTTKMGEKHGVPRIRSLGHEEAGIEPAKAFLSRLTFGQEVRQAAASSAKDHLKPGMFQMQYEAGKLSDDQYANALRKWLKRNYQTDAKVLLAISEADYRGRTLPGVQTEPYQAGLHAMRVIKKLGLDQEPSKPLVQGRDLIELGYQPGPLFGQIIERIEGARDEGEIKTREEALELAKQWMLE